MLLKIINRDIFLHIECTIYASINPFYMRVYVTCRNRDIMMMLILFADWLSPLCSNTDHWPYAPGVCIVTGMSWWILHSRLIECSLRDNPWDLHSGIPARSGMIPRDYIHLMWCNLLISTSPKTWRTWSDFWDTLTCVGRLVCPGGRVSSLNKSNPIHSVMRKHGG